MDELTIAFKIESPPSWLPIGRTAENNWRTVEIDCSYWFNMSADGEVVLMYKPSCGMSPYPLLTEREGDNIIWRPKSGELVEGVGRLQAFFEVGTDVIGSSDMISCEVDSSLLGVGPGTDPGQTDLPWALDIIEQIAELSGHYPKIIDGDLYIWDSTLNDWVEFEASGGAVDSVNGQTGVVVLDASDVGALPDSTVIPPIVTEQTVAGWGFTKNTGTYSKPSGGIPKSDLASAVQTSLGKADTALQTAPVSSVNNKTGVVSLNASDVGATPEPLEIPVTESDGTYSTTVTAEQIRAAKEHSVFVLGGIRIDATAWIPSFFDEFDLLVGVVDFDLRIQVYASLRGASVSVSVSSSERLELPTVTASDNGKFLRVVSGVWAAQVVPFQTPRVAMTSADTTPTLDPNKLYVFPTMATLTPTLATPSDNSIVNEYHFIFTSGATAATLTIPAAIHQPDGFTVEANHVYEVSILENCMTAQGWAVSA